MNIWGPFDWYIKDKFAQDFLRTETELLQRVKELHPHITDRDLQRVQADFERQARAHVPVQKSLNWANSRFWVHTVFFIASIIAAALPDAGIVKALFAVGYGLLVGLEIGMLVKKRFDNRNELNDLVSEVIKEYEEFGHHHTTHQILEHVNNKAIHRERLRQVRDDAYRVRASNRPPPNNRRYSSKQQHKRIHAAFFQEPIRGHSVEMQEFGQQRQQRLSRSSLRLSV